MSGGMFTGALTSGAMVLLDAWGAKRPRDEVLSQLVALLLLVLVTTFTAVLVSRAWSVDTLLDQELGMPMSRTSFIWGMVGDQRGPVEGTPPLPRLTVRLSPCRSS